MAQVRTRAEEAMRGVRGAPPEEVMAVPFSFLESIPASAYTFAMFGSILASLGLFLSGRRWEGLFVGLWAPTFASLGLFYKLLHPSREIRQMR